jgi:hypothetical protein
LTGGVPRVRIADHPTTEPKPEQYGIRKIYRNLINIPDLPRIGLGSVVQSEKYFYEQRAEEAA